MEAKTDATALRKTPAELWTPVLENQPWLLTALKCPQVLCCVWGLPRLHTQGYLCVALSSYKQLDCENFLKGFLSPYSQP